MGDAGCLSFHPRKSITTGEGGMVLTNDREFAHRVEILRDHGAELFDSARREGKELLLPEYNNLGYNYRMTDFQAALGVTQMRKLSFILERKRKLAARYCDALADLKWLQLPVAPKGYEHSYQSFVCLFQPESLSEINPERLSRLHQMRNELMSRLKTTA